MTGIKPLAFKDGTVDPDSEIMLYSFDAATYEGAMAIYYIRQGWSPYEPDGESESCPKCNAIFYPSGSGECWQCHYSIYVK